MPSTEPSHSHPQPPARGPSFVFEYLPATVKPSSSLPSSTSTSGTSTPSPSHSNIHTSASTHQPSTFLASLTRALTPVPKMSREEQETATLRQVKAGFEQHMAVKQRVGIAVDEGDRERLGRIERALALAGRGTEGEA